MIAPAQHWTFAVAAILVFAVIGLWETARPAHAQSDVQMPRRLVNFALAALHALLVLILPLSQAVAAAMAKSHGLGLLNLLSLPGIVAATLTVVLASLLAYLTHIALHRLPLLWRFHAIHHDDREIDASTALRHHPGEILLIAAIQMPVIVLFGLDPAVLVVLYVCEWLHGLFAHANVRLPKRLDEALAYVLVTPAMHAVHHSAHRDETDSNFGAMFSGWDRLFGTFRTAANEPPQFGLGPDGSEPDAGLIQALRTPLR